MAEGVAIVGMSAVFPGAPDLATFWSNLEHGVDAISEVPATRLDPVFAAAFYCKRGGFISASFDAAGFGIMPLAAAAAEPDQLLALQAAAGALEDAGMAGARRRYGMSGVAGVILGRGGYLTAGMARLSNRVRTSQQLVTTLGELLPELDSATVERIRAAFERQSGDHSADAAIGLVPNLAASRIANRLDLRGPAYTVDAACASSLLAIDQGCRELGERRCDVVVAGGVHLCHDVTFWSVFTQLGALSRSSTIRPFDRKADGMLIGEGTGMLVLKRLADAERDGDRIYAVIRGSAVSSDGREATAMRPSPEGQLAALRGAWRAAGMDPAGVGLLEAHGTATPTGDEVELDALARFFGTSERRAALGSVKSMIGHSMPAAGAAGIIKAALALHHGVVPPSLHCEEPHPALQHTRFRVPSAAEPWDAELPRVAGVSAFGFGGINAHVVLEAHASSLARDAGAAFGMRALAEPRVLAVAGDSPAELKRALEAGVSSTRGAMRLALLDPTPERRALALKVLERGKALRGHHDIWFSPERLADGGKLAFVFPGIEAHFAPRVDDVAAELGLPLPAAIATAIDAAGATPRELELRGGGVFALGRLLLAALARRGVEPDAIAGHSMGEWTGMVASEMIPPAEADAFVARLPAGSLEVPDVLFVAAGCSASVAEEALAGLAVGAPHAVAEVAVSHDNCPHQSILCGRREAMALARAALARRGVLCQELPFRSGYHSPLFSDYLAPNRRHLAGLTLVAPRVPLWSATRCAPYPDAPDAIRQLAIDHLVEPVRFRELIETMYAAGFRAFVQLGVGSLIGFINDTLRGKSHLAVAAASAQHSGLSQLARVSAALFVDDFIAAVEPAPATRGRALPLELGVPLVRLAGVVPPLSLAAPRPAPEARDPLMHELLATLDEAAAASRAVVEAYRSALIPRRSVSQRTLSVESDAALADHCFYRQPPGGPMADRYPVVPMTMLIELMLEAARGLMPGRVATVVEDVHALRWLAVAPAVTIEIIANLREAARVEVEIPGYARASVRFADDYARAPAPALPPLEDARPAPLSPERLYADRWLFHGPAYQGIVALGPLADGGVDGVIAALPAPGALLDCAGQLMGWWVMHTQRQDRLAMPVTIRRLTLYGPAPAAGERVSCRVRIRHVGEREARADLELLVGGALWARIDGWEDRRFDSDDAVWDMLIYPERHVLASAHEGGWVSVREHWRTAASRELMMRRYLGEAERAEHEQVALRARRGWLLGRIAIKDAVRSWLWARGHGALFPVEVAVSRHPGGRPLVTLPAGARHELTVSVAHKDDVAVAIVGEGEDVGIDIETIAPRSESFVAASFTAEELALGQGRERDDWLTRLWAAKEAVAKARGSGLTDPRKLVVRAAQGERLSIDDEVIDTHREGEQVIAWTRRSRA